MTYSRAILELEESIEVIKWHAIGLPETRLTGENMVTQKSGNIL